MDDVSLSGIGNFITSMNRDGNWYCVRVNASEGSVGYFNTASFSIVWNLSSLAYGWAICMSDNDITNNFIVFGKLSSRNWRWFEIQRNEVI